MKIKIIFSKKFLRKLRENTAAFLTVLKLILIIGGSFTSLIGSLGLDAPGESGDLAIKFLIYGMIAAAASTAVEAFIVRFLVHEDECISTIFNFSFYGLKSKNNYLEYRHRMKRKLQKRENSVINEKQTTYGLGSQNTAM